VYLGFRIAMTWIIGIHGLKQKSLKKSPTLIPAWDSLSFLIWLTMPFQKLESERGCGNSRLTRSSKVSLRKQTTTALWANNQRRPYSLRPPQPESRKPATLQSRTT
jgi:hypothetical protein